MKAAIYSRKSKFTGKGESIENQVQLCKDYSERLNINEFEIYEDEGFSGGNIDRPEFQRLLKDAKEKKFNVLICYRLDRISRNIGDFSNLIDELQSLSISFISIREQFDTSTPMGRAMMYIASVFAQLERETIAERIRDNMLELAKTGRWLGGQTPLGFKSEKINYIDSEFKERSMHKLTPIDDELKVVNLIYNKYLELKSLRKVNQFLLESRIKTKLGADWNVRAISDLLSSPTYVKANNDVFKYLSEKGITVVGKPNSINGILTYNKKKGKNQYRDTDEWIAAIAKHEGIIDSNKWIEVQNALKDNKLKAPRLGKTHNALFTGILRCGKCGSNMTVIHGRKDKDGNKLFYYGCAMKIASKGSRCNNSNIRTDDIEEVVINQLKDSVKNSEVLIEELRLYKEELASATTNNNELEIVEKSIVSTEESIGNLVNQLAENKSSLAAKFIIKEIEKRSEELESLNMRKEKLLTKSDEVSEANINIDVIAESLSKFTKFIDTADNDYKKYLISSILEKLTWDSSTGEIDIQLWGSGKKK